MKPLRTPILRSLSPQARLFTAFFSLSLLLIASLVPARGQTEILNETLRGGELPGGWSQEGVTFSTAAGGYANFTTLEANLSTPVFDASEFDKIEVDFDVAKFGSGIDGPITLEYSVDGGSTWEVAGVSPVPTDANYLSASLVIEDLSDTMVLRFSRPDSPSQKRLRDVVVTGLDGAPVFGELSITDITDVTADASVIFSPGDGTGFVEYGFVYAETAVDDMPERGEPGVTTVVVGEVPTGNFQAELDDLDPAVNYTVRAYAEYAEGLIYSDPVAFSTRPPLPVLTSSEAYTETFVDFVSAETVPAGWSFDFGSSSSAYIGDWNDPELFSAGLRGNASVLGYQITGPSNSLTKILTLINGTGEEITTLTVGYLGRVGRAAETRQAAYTVYVDGVLVPALAYTTDDGDNVLRIAIVDGLSIPDGDTFTIEWDANQLSGTGSTRQIGISSAIVQIGGDSLPPTIAYLDLFEPSLGETEFGVDADIASDGGSPILAMGFVLSETAIDPNPTLDTPGATIVYEDFPGVSFFFYDFTGLMPGTAYSVRAFATNAVGTTYSSTLNVTTLAPPPSLNGSDPYVQGFENFLGQLPPGWTAISSGGVNAYQGVWGTGTGAGTRGGVSDPGVLGYQHTGTSGIFTVTLTLVNDTGSTINNLLVSYLGRVERADQGRMPAWTVEVDGIEVPALAYSTAAGEDLEVSALVTGLSIANGEEFTITWSSDRGLDTTGSSRQIGIADVVVEVFEGEILQPVTATVPSGSYVGPLFVDLESPDEDVLIFYTTDGSEPTEESTLYTDTLEFTESVTLKARAYPAEEESPILPSSVSTFNYMLAIPVTSLAELADPDLGVLYVINSEIVVSYIDLGGFRDQCYFVDDTGGIFVDDVAGFLNAPDTLEVGDGVTGLAGVFSTFNNQLQFVPQVSAGTVTSTGNTLTPLAVTLDELESDFLAYRYRLVVVNSVVFDTADGEAVFPGGGQTLPLSDLSGSGEFRVFFSTDYIGTVIPEGVLNIVGIPNSQTAGNFLSARSLADITEADDPGGESLEDFYTLYGLTGGDATPLADPAGDGIANIIKYAFGGNPLVSDPGTLPQAAVIEDEDELYLGYVVHLGQPFTWNQPDKTLYGTDVSIQIQESFNLTAWDQADVVLLGNFPGGNIPANTTVVFRTTTPIDELPPTFLQADVFVNPL